MPTSQFYAILLLFTSIFATYGTELAKNVTQPSGFIDSLERLLPHQPDDLRVQCGDVGWEDDRPAEVQRGPVVGDQRGDVLRYVSCMTCRQVKYLLKILCKQICF